MNCRAPWMSLAVLSLLVGCASGGSTTPTQPMAQALGSGYKTVAIKVIASVPDAEGDALSLENAIITELRKEPRFTKVISRTGSPDTKVDLVVNANITDIRKVSQSKRVILGGLAGRGSVTVQADLVDGRNGKKLGSFSSEGKTSGGTVFSGTTEQALRRAAEQVAGFVRQSLGT